MFADALAAYLQGALAAKPVRDGLATFAGKPAILTLAPPQDCPLPAVTLEDSGGRAEDTRATVGVVADVEVKVLAAHQGDEAARVLARKLHAALHRADLRTYLSEWTAVACLCDPPEKTQDQLGMPGFTLRVHITAQRQ